MKEKRRLNLWSRRCFKGMILVGWLSILTPCLGEPAAESAYAQQVHFSFTLRNADFDELMQQIKKRSNYEFVYKDREVMGIQGLNRTFSEAGIEEVLMNCLEGSHLTFEVKDNLILIYKQTEQQQQAEAKTREVRGRVTGENKEPLIGVTVMLKGSTIGVVTNNNGEYAILIPAKGEEVLYFSFVGMKSKEVAVGKQSVVNVMLEEDVAQLEDVVVTGIFTRKAESYSGSAVTIKAEELKRVGNQNLFQSLKNLDPSLMIFDNLVQGSNPNALPSMQLRGASTFPGDGTVIRSRFIDDPNTPLFILDGFETKMEKIFDMDMNRIESVTILKDAAAKAIYGAKAANGVVVIETKRLTGNQTLVTYNGSVDVEMPDLTSYNLCNALEKLEVERREGYYESLGTFLDDRIDYLQLYNDRLKKAKEGLDTYWLSKPLRTGVGHKHSVDIEIGEGAVRASAFFMYNDTKGVMKGSDRQVINGDVNLAYRRKGILFRNIMSISDMKSNDSPYGEFSTYTELNPYWEPYDENGYLRQYLDAPEYGQKGIANPLYDARLNVSLKDAYLNFTNNFYVEIQALDALKLVARIGVDVKKTEAEEFYPSNHSKFMAYTDYGEGALRKGSYEMSNGKSNTLSGDFSAQYNQTFKRHDLFATAQWSVSESKYSEVTHYAEGFPNDRMNSIIYARQYAVDHTPSGDSGLNRSLGYLLVGGYSFDNRYMMDATLKGNASSVFGTDKRWGTFWSIGAAWNVHNEAFLKNSPWVEQLKLRFSVGSTGNPNYATNKSLAIYQYYTDKYYQNFSGAYLLNMENNQLGWEQKMDYTIGLDARIAGLTLKLDFYRADTRDMAFNRTVVTSTGFSAVTDNLGKVRNEGIELSASYAVWRAKDGFLNLNFKIATNKNRIRKISDALEAYNETVRLAAYRENQTEPVIQYYDGVPLHSIWAVKSLGIDPTTGLEVFLDKEGNKTFAWSASNLIHCGSQDPKYNGNFGLTGEYKGFGLNAVFTFYGGGYLYNTTLLDKVENCYIGNNVDRRVFSDRWYIKGQNAQYINGYENGGTQPTSRFVQKNNVLNVSSLSAYYEFPTQWIRKIRLQRLRLSAYMNDVYTFSNIRIERGTSYPFARTLSFALTATF